MLPKHHRKKMSNTYEPGVAHVTKKGGGCVP